MQAFFGVNPSTFVDSVSSMLSLVDGGGNGEEIPISSLLIRQRNVDVIVAIDGSADDVNQWPE
jgi:lysophospholipase